ncbi:MAG: hypothetical protein ACTHOG_10455 [Marmoricola sp.]
MRLRAVVAAAVVPALGLTLAGCGQSAVDSYVKTAPAKMDQDVRDAMTALTSIHVHTVQTVNTTPFVLDISVDNAGRCIGTLSLGTQTLNLIGLSGTKVYARASADFWSKQEGANAATATALANKWVTGLPTSMFASTCDIKSLVGSFTQNSVANDKPKVLGKVKIDGTEAVTLQITLNGTAVKIAVDPNAPHRPLQVTSSGGKLTSTFTQFDKPVRPTAPAGAQDVKTLTGGK